MAAQQADFTATFRGLNAAAAGDDTVRTRFADPAAFDDWAVRWRARLAQDGGTAEERRAVMRTANPALIARNHRVEEAIAAAVTDANFAPFERLVAALAAPFDDDPAYADLTEPARPEELVQQTFCGT